MEVIGTCNFILRPRRAQLPLFIIRELQLPGIICGGFSHPSLPCCFCSTMLFQPLLSNTAASLTHPRINRREREKRSGHLLGAPRRSLFHPVPLLLAFAVIVVAIIISGALLISHSDGASQSVRRLLPNPAVSPPASRFPPYRPPSLSLAAQSQLKGDFA